jgi:hypothetical protein
VLDYPKIVSNETYLIFELANPQSKAKESTPHFFTGSVRDQDSTSEAAVAQFYEESGYQVLGFDSRFRDTDITADDTLPTPLQQQIKSQVTDVDTLDRKGKPDYLVYLQDEEEIDYHFVEVKSCRESFSRTQLEWAMQFDHLPYKLCFVHSPN